MEIVPLVAKKRKADLPVQQNSLPFYFFFRGYLEELVFPSGNDFKTKTFNTTKQDVEEFSLR
jgi:hypothetical protein